jgi:hypothetical protein
MKRTSGKKEWGVAVKDGLETKSGEDGCFGEKKRNMAGFIARRRAMIA